MAEMESLLLLPGLLCDRFVWEWPRRELSQTTEIRVIEWGPEDSLQQMAETALRSAPERFAVAGHSMGGRVALEVYRRAPDRVTRIALLNTGYQARSRDAAGEQEERNRMALLNLARADGMRAMARQWIPPMIRPDRRAEAALVEPIVEMFARKTPEIFERQIRALLHRPDAGGVLDQIRCPALILTGREDTWSPPARHQEMASLVRGSRLAVIPRCAHMSTLEQPEAVTAALREWLAAAPTAA